MVAKNFPWVWKLDQSKVADSLVWPVVLQTMPGCAVHLWLTACILLQLMSTDVLIQYLCVVGGVSCQAWKNSKVTNKHVYCPQTRSLYAGSDSGVVQSPTAFCSRYRSCFDCILARDPYCAWDHRTATCVNIFDAPRQSHRYLYIINTFNLYEPSSLTHSCI